MYLQRRSCIKLIKETGSGIAPFFPISSPTSNPVLLPYHAVRPATFHRLKLAQLTLILQFLFFFRLPFLLFAWAVWLALIQWLPAGSLLRKANLWCILGIPGVWWVDIRVDGVQRGSLGKTGRLPAAGDVIAASYTSPLDVLYLAAIFDPIFTQSFPGSRSVRPLSFEGALAACFTLPSAPDHRATDLLQLAADNPGRIIIVFPESTTSNGRGILRLSPSLLSVSKKTTVFPVSMRYSPADVVTPLPGAQEAVRFVWKLCSRQTHTIRVRVGMPMNMAWQQKHGADESAREAKGVSKGANGYDTNYFDSLRQSSHEGPEEGLKENERRALDAVAETLSRLGRAKTLGLGVEDKARFVDAWGGKSKGKRRKSGVKA